MFRSEESRARRRRNFVRTTDIQLSTSMSTEKNHIKEIRSVSRRLTDHVLSVPKTPISTAAKHQKCNDQAGAQHKKEREATLLGNGVEHQVNAGVVGIKADHNRVVLAIALGCSCCCC